MSAAQHTRGGSQAGDDQGHCANQSRRMTRPARLHVPCRYQKVINDMYAQLKKASSQQAS